MSPGGQAAQIPTSQATASAPPKPNHPSSFNAIGTDNMQPAGVIKPPPIQPPPSSGLAVQRPSSQLRMGMGNQMDSFNLETKDQRSTYYDQPFRNMNYNQVDSMQSHYQQGNAQPSNPLHMSRLNPRASVFSSMQSGPGPHQNANKPTNQPANVNQGFSGNASGLFQPNTSQTSNANLNPYQKMSYSNPNTVGGQMPSNYNPAPGRPQSQPQVGSNGRWFSDFNHLNHASPNEIMSMESGALMMAMNSPAMSPNNNNNNAPAPGNGGNAPGGNKAAFHDDSRKMPRPIGTERASWKYGSGSNANVGGNLENSDAVGQPQMPPWLLDKNQLPSQPLGQQQPPWMQYPLARNHFVDELHMQDPYQVSFCLFTNHIDIIKTNWTNETIHLY